MKSFIYFLAAITSINAVLGGFLILIVGSFRDLPEGALNGAQTYLLIAIILTLWSKL